jgi:hypothetical protein
MRCDINSLRRTNLPACYTRTNSQAPAVLFSFCGFTIFDIAGQISDMEHIILSAMRRIGSETKRPFPRRHGVLPSHRSACSDTGGCRMRRCRKCAAGAHEEATYCAQCIVSNKTSGLELCQCDNQGRHCRRECRCYSRRRYSGRKAWKRRRNREEGYGCSRSNRV